jgi:hypothetical protein
MNWVIIDQNGKRTALPSCSYDWKPSAFWISACLHDPDSPICRTHQQYFRQRKETSGGQ